MDKNNQLKVLLAEYGIDENLGKRFFKVVNNKLVGKQIAFKIQNKDVENPTFLKWLDAQSNLTDSIRYLIEQEIIHNGIRNLGKIIPQERNLEETLKELKNKGNKPEGQAVPTSTQSIPNRASQETESASPLASSSQGVQITKNEEEKPSNNDEPLPAGTAANPNVIQNPNVSNESEPKEEIIEGWNF